MHCSSRLIKQNRVGSYWYGTSVSIFLTSTKEESAANSRMVGDYLRVGGCGGGLWGKDGGFKVLNCSRSCAETNLCQSDIYNHSFHYPLGSLWHIYPCAFKSSDFYTSFYIQSLQILSLLGRICITHPQIQVWILFELKLKSNIHILTSPYISCYGLRVTQ